MTKKFQVSSKKWAYREGVRGYGYVTKRVTKYVCTGSETRDLSNTNMNQNIPNIPDLKKLVRSNYSEGLNVGSDNDVGRLVNNYHSFESESQEMD